MTQRSDQIIHFFAFFTLSSSPQERRYITPAIIRAITARTEVYLIIAQITLPITHTALLLVVLTFTISHQLQPGKPTQLISGFHHPEELLEEVPQLKENAETSRETAKKEQNIRIRTIKRDFIIFILTIEKVSNKINNIISRKSNNKRSDSSSKNTFSSGKKLVITMMNNHISCSYCHNKKRDNSKKNHHHLNNSSNSVIDCLFSSSTYKLSSKRKIIKLNHKTWTTKTI
jgi:hypothetical protein